MFTVTHPGYQGKDAQDVLTRLRQYLMRDDANYLVNASSTGERNEYIAYLQVNGQEIGECSHIHSTYPLAILCGTDFVAWVRANERMWFQIGRDGEEMLLYPAGAY